MTRDVDNQALGKWLGFHKAACGWHPENAKGCFPAFPDFYRDEAACALLLEKMRRPLLVSDWPGCEGWRVDIGVIKFGGKPKGPTDLDRKTAICLAALKLIAEEEKPCER